jgi:hypothetical protein
MGFAPSYPRGRNDRGKYLKSPNLQARCVAKWTHLVEAAGFFTTGLDDLLPCLCPF